MNELLRRLLHLPPQASSVARGIDILHYTVILATMAGVTLAAAIAFMFVVRYRRRTAAIPLTPRIIAPAWLETLVIGGLLGLFCLWWVIGFAQYRELQTTPPDAIPIYVTAKQWMWQFAYPEGPTSSDVLTVPVGRPVKLIMTSRDVIHSFFVPEFRVKQDVVPGRAVTTWFTAVEPGAYDVLCTQYCGTRHSLMRAQVVALPDADYARWIDASRAPLALPGAKGDGRGLAERGRDVAAVHGCLRCHSVDGTPFIGPTWAHAFGSRRRTTDGRERVVDEAYLTESMMDPRAEVASGFAPVMPSYQGALTPAEVAAILEYIRSLRDVVPVVTEPPPVGAVTFPGGLPRLDQRDVPDGEQRDVPAGDQRSAPGTDQRQRSAPGGDQRSTSGGDQRSTPGGDQRSTPGGDQRSTPGGDQRSTPGGDQRSVPGGAP